jgi:uncharacterized NAD(P)/FAD-binding protein YdhS
MNAVGDRHVLIIGGGASGALLAIQMLRSASGVRVTIIEKRAELGRGFAYGEALPFHLLNVRAANMSAYPDNRDHFIDWLDRNRISDGVTGEGGFRFAPRPVFGRYISEQLAEQADAESNWGRLTRVHGEAVALTRSPDGVSATMADGRRIAGTVAVIATGYAPPRGSALPFGIPLWKAIDPASLDDIERVLIVGTGHSAIDHLQSLVAAGYQGAITMISRRGLLPRVHRPIEPASIDPQDIPFGARLSAVWRWLRQTSDAAERTGLDWRAVLDGLRPHAQSLWQSLTPEEQRRFLRHARAWYDVRRHRMAPPIAAQITRLLESGQLTVIAGTILTVTELRRKSGTVEVVYRRRGQSAKDVLRTEAVIDCSGFDLDVAHSDNPLVRNLLADGLAQADPLGLGFKVGASCALIQPNGQEASDLFAVGPLTRGQFWETVGIPDIRLQCAILAEKLAEGDLAAADDPEAALTAPSRPPLTPAL